MKTIVAVIFLGMFTYAFGDYPRINVCRKVTPMKNFNSAMFFSGTWYMTNVKKGLSSAACHELKTEKKSANLKIKYEYRRNGGKYEVTCKGEDKYETIPFSCVIDVPGLFKQDKKFQANYTILTTDYNNYAVYYRCVKSEKNVLADDFVVLNRKKDNEEIPSSANTVLNKHVIYVMTECSKLPTEDDINSQIV